MAETYVVSIGLRNLIRAEAGKAATASKEDDSNHTSFYSSPH
jgi:hypothetical protein